MATEQILHLWQGFGVELEYMIVDAHSLDVRPIADEAIRQVAGEYLAEVELGDVCWSNELALHVIELKTNGPSASLTELTARFHDHVNRMNQVLRPLDARLMPTAMHPWMDPFRELKLWPHEYNPVYETFHRIFDCRGHGWANLQSVHLNLPFSGDEEFGRLHAAIRLLLPLLPALAASSPVVDRRLTGLADNRLEVYGRNAEAVPLVSGDVIPEAVFSRRAYEDQVFQPMYRAIAPFDPEGVLQFEWLNARGAIARFDRHAIEIRVLDVQECPAADLAICQAVVAVLQQLVAERWSPFSRQCEMPVAPLRCVLNAAMRDAEEAVIDDREFLTLWGVDAARLTIGQLWRRLADACSLDAAAEAPLGVILNEGPLARRIARALDGDVERLPHVYRSLCDCLALGAMFKGC